MVWTFRSSAAGLALGLLVLLGGSACLADDTAATSQSRIVDAITNAASLPRPGRDGLATIWDGNKYIQCRLLSNRDWICEAAGTLLQPSLKHVLSEERIRRLATLGWLLDPRFGNYVHVFSARTPPEAIAKDLMDALAEGYDADLANLEVESAWVKSEPCPPRNGPSQNLAGMINDDPAMASTAIRDCIYHPPADEPPPAADTLSAPDPAETVTTADLIHLYGDRVTGEIQRLRVNLEQRVFVAFDSGAGYVQCEPETSPAAIYCEAQSADSWPALASVLTPERVNRLHTAGFADPGYSQNYSRRYLPGQFSDRVIAEEVLGILHDVYGYNGSHKLEFATEKGDR